MRASQRWLDVFRDHYEPDLVTREGEQSPVRTLLLINALLDQSREDEIAAGRSPRKDYLELRRALNADVIDLGVLHRRLWTRLVRRLVGAGAAQAVLAWTQRAHYDAIFADRETTGFAFAALCKLSRRRPRVTMIGHLLSPTKKRLLCRALRLRDDIDCVIVHSSLQQRIAERTLGFRPEQVVCVPYHADESFWTPRDAPFTQQICSAGLEYRDYDTLIEAVAGLDVALVIGAASHWSKHRGIADQSQLPPNVRVASFDYTALRQLYAESLFVVVPLKDVENQAGITTILEAMAMGKAVVVSHSRGQTDVVRDRRQRNRTLPERNTQPDWARALGATDGTAQGHTGMYVTPGDPAELRRAITFLLAHPEQAQAMGAQGRRLLEETMGLDHFTRRVAALIAQGQSMAPAGPPREVIAAAPVSG